MRLSKNAVFVIENMIQKAMTVVKILKEVLKLAEESAKTS